MHDIGDPQASLVVLGVMLGVTTYTRLYIIPSSQLRRYTSTHMRETMVHFLSTLELCYVAWERSRILHHSLPYPVYLSMWLVLAVACGRGSVGALLNPCALLRLATLRLLTPLQALTTLGAQILAAWVAYSMTAIVWGYGMSTLHTSHAAETCSSSLQTTAPMGMLLEASATLIFLIATREYNRRNSKYDEWFGGATAIGITLLGMQYTGMYFNPVLATSLELLCAGTNLQTFLLVYWLAPLLATLVFMRLYKEI